MVLAALAVAIWPTSRAIALVAVACALADAAVQLGYGSHWPSDLLGAWVLGGLCGFVVPRAAGQLARARGKGNSPLGGGVSWVRCTFLSWSPKSTASSEARDLAVRARDRVRFEEDALAYADDAYRVARRLTGSTEAAEELVQDAYVRAFRSWEQYTPGTNLRAWLLRIVHNLAVDAGRKRQRTPQMEPVEESDYYLYQRMGGTSTPEEADTVVERLSQGGVVSALAALPQPYRDAVVLVDLADFSYQDAADILDVPIGTIMSRLHRGRRMLKTELAQTIENTAEAAAS